MMKFRIFVTLLLLASFAIADAQSDLKSVLFGGSGDSDNYQNIYASYGFSHTTADYCPEWGLVDYLYN